MFSSLFTWYPVFISLRVLVHNGQTGLRLQKNLVAVQNGGLVGVEDTIHLLLLLSAQSDRLNHGLVIPPPPHRPKLQRIVGSAGGSTLSLRMARLFWSAGPAQPARTTGSARGARSISIVISALLGH
jgi:hypothetical protein